MTEGKTSRKDSTKRSAKPPVKTISKTVDWKNSKSHKGVGDVLMKIFNCMDKDKDGFISEQDLTAHFREYGIFRNRHQAKEWISTRDLDQDGKLSAEEFLSSYLLQYDNHSKDSLHVYNPLIYSLGYLRLTTSIQLTTLMTDSILENVLKVLRSPNLVASHVVSINMSDVNGVAAEKIQDIYLAMGFINHQNQPLKFIYGSSSGNLTDSQLQSLQESYNSIQRFCSLLIDPSLSDPDYGKLIYI